MKNLFMALAITSMSFSPIGLSAAECNCGKEQECRCENCGCSEGECKCSQKEDCECECEGGCKRK